MFNIDHIIDSLDAEVLEDFSIGVHNELDAVEQHIMSLRGGRGDESCIEGILASVEKINVQCRLTFLDPLLAYVETVGVVVNKIYRYRNHQCENLTELILLMFDEIRAACDEVFVRHSLDLGLLNEFRQSMKELLEGSEEDFDEYVSDMLSSFAYRIHPDMVFKASEVSPTLHMPKVNRNEELSVFEDIAVSLDNRNPITVGRTVEVLRCCLSINRYLPERLSVNDEQLTAAVYLHDMAMVYFPDSVLYKTGKFTPEEIMLLQQHPAQGYRLLNVFPQWQSAAQMVLQHHERYDGKGYPNRLLGPNICQGASIIALADAFYSLTHQRSDRQFKKSTLRALLEINKNNGTQFDPASVEALNSVFQESV